MNLLWWYWRKSKRILELIKNMQETILENKVIFTKSKNSTLWLIKLENIQESNPKTEVYTSIYNNRVLTKDGNLYKENLQEKRFWVNYWSDGPSRPSVIPYLKLFFLLLSSPTFCYHERTWMTVRYVHGGLSMASVLQYLESFEDGYWGYFLLTLRMYKTVCQAMTVRRETP